MVQDWELYSVQEELDPETKLGDTKESQETLAWMRTLDLAPREPTATDESTEAHDRKDRRDAMQSYAKLIQATLCQPKLCYVMLC